MLLDGLECFLAVLDASGRYGVVFPVLDDNQWDWMVLIIIGWYWTILDGMLVQWMVLDGIVCYWMDLDGIVWYWMELDGMYLDHKTTLRSSHQNVSNEESKKP